MVEIAVSLGSNINREYNICASAREIRRRHPGCVFSPVFSSAAVGFEGPPFLNLVAVFESDAKIDAVISELREIEDQLGRQRVEDQMTSRTIDLDLLLYGDLVFYDQGIDVPRSEILEYAHVLKPLSLVMPDACHPVTGQRYADLWAAMSIDKDGLLEEEALEI